MNEHIYFFSHRKFADVWPRLASAFEVDRLLKRTFLRALPVWELHKIVPTRMFNFSDICVAFTTLFPRGILNKEKVAAKCFNVLVFINVSDSQIRLDLITPNHFILVYTRFFIW